MKINRLNLIKAFFVFSFLFAATGSLAQQSSKPDTLRLFMIGNSFSRNAAEYLPQLALEGNHPLVIGRAEIGGCSLKKHWELVELAERDPADLKGKPYDGKSLRMLLENGTWDVVTIQQNSMNSADVNTYQPYARKLYDFIKTLQPNAQVVFHQTWAYRSDSKDFSQIANGQFAKSSDEMWQKSRAAYHAVASELGIKIMPVGDAFQKVAASKRWGYRADSEFNLENPVYPHLPNQNNSLHAGYYWKKDKTFKFDSHHANDAGCFLGSLVWYRFLFGESPERLRFVPKKVPKEFGAHLKKVANSVVEEQKGGREIAGEKTGME